MSPSPAEDLANERRRISSQNPCPQFDVISSAPAADSVSSRSFSGIVHSCLPDPTTAPREALVVLIDHKLPNGYVDKDKSQDVESNDTDTALSILLQDVTQPKLGMGFSKNGGLSRFTTLIAGLLESQKGHPFSTLPKWYAWVDGIRSSKRWFLCLVYKVGRMVCNVGLLRWHSALSPLLAICGIPAASFYSPGWYASLADLLIWVWLAG
ncbi:hypothetical protein Nepgr_032340 [Nepenthes gracilis]|uniref:Uncharacterized protein n=1 Tax=Nepenthes gracilis TaxID=150966 RepID=A0AAD3TKM9_NEPGR|nr:hypothetical protein Nepgr_032340 [Nepenthes gracilis]